MPGLVDCPHRWKAEYSVKDLYWIIRHGTNGESQRAFPDVISYEGTILKSIDQWIDEVHTYERDDD